MFSIEKMNQLSLNFECKKHVLNGIKRRNARNVPWQRDGEGRGRWKIMLLADIFISVCQSKYMRGAFSFTILLFICLWQIGKYTLSAHTLPI